MKHHKDTLAQVALSQSKKAGTEVHSIPYRILVPTDGSKNSDRALNLAISFASAFDSDIIVLTVLPAPRTVVEVGGGAWIPTSTARHHEGEENTARSLLDDAISLCQRNGIKGASSEIIRASQSIVGEIVEFSIRRKIDLIVIGTRGQRGFRKLVQGSVSSGVVTHAQCNVLVVR